MIEPNAKLTIQRIPLKSVQVREFQFRDLERIRHYVDLYHSHPGYHAGLINVRPSDTHAGSYAILDGHHRYIASLIAGRDDILAVIEEEAAQ